MSAENEEQTGQANDLDEAPLELVEDAPPPPERHGGPPEGDPRRKLWLGVRRALEAVPALFKTELYLKGLRATDIYTLNSALGTSIENSVVEILNDLRDIWDPANELGVREYQAFSFKRQSQTWPDVLLVTGSADAKPIMGIELKGWFVLSKEGEPSFRYKVSPAVCTDMDLIAVYPWALSEVISGVPQLMAPFIEEARYAAEMRNYHWQYQRAAKSSTEITPAVNQDPYPKSGAKFLDVPKADGGGNFGRASRAGIMNDFISRVFDNQVSGIPVKAWHAFFATFRESADLTAITGEIQTRRTYAQHASNNEDDKLAALLRQMLDYIGDVTGVDVVEWPPILASELRITVDVSLQTLQERLEGATAATEIVSIRSGSLTVPAYAPLSFVKSRIQALLKQDVATTRVDINMGNDGLLKIARLRKA